MLFFGPERDKLQVGPAVTSPPLTERAPRTNVSLPATLTTMEGEEVSATIKYLSATGARVEL